MKPRAPHCLQNARRKPSPKGQPSRAKMPVALTAEKSRKEIVATEDEPGVAEAKEDSPKEHAAFGAPPEYVRARSGGLIGESSEEPEPTVIVRPGSQHGREPRRLPPAPKRGVFREFLEAQPFHLVRPRRTLRQKNASRRNVS